jgi:hypothetical protein
MSFPSGAGNVLDGGLENLEILYLSKMQRVYAKRLKDLDVSHISQIRAFVSICERDLDVFQFDSPTTGLSRLRHV